MRAFILAVTGLAFGFTACSSDGTTVVDPGEKDPAAVASVSVSLPSSSLIVGQTQRATATALDANGAALTGRTITWQSSAVSVASVSDQGDIAAISPGTALLSATSEGVTGQTSMAVMPLPPAPVATVTVSLSSSSIIAGQSAQATAILKDASGNSLTGRIITWQSSDAAVATVSNTGAISGVAAGSATITASSEGKSGSAGLTVTAIPPVPVASVTVSPATPSVQAGATVQLSAVTKDASGNVLTGRPITWTSSNTSVATISGSGLVTAIIAGSATITATSGTVTGTAALTVTAPAPVPVATVTVTPAAPSVQVGATVQLSAVPRDANGNVLTGRTITWSSSNNSVATVSSSGLVGALVAGTVTITATCGGAAGTASVTVNQPASPTTIFSDDFESGSLSKWNESNSTTQAILTDAANAHGGSKFLRMTYGINGGDAAWLNKYLPQGFRQLYVRYYARFSTNWAGGTKLVALRGAPLGNPGGALGRAGICPTGRDSYTADLVTEFGSGETYPSKFYAYWQDMWADSNGQCWGRYGPTPSTSTWPYFLPMPEMSKGVWHKIELTAKENSSATAADGVIRFWIDGVKYGEWTGIRFGDPAYVDFEVLTLSGQGDGSRIQTVDVDDLLLTSDFPSQSQP
jgi:uncharacterized protein YjdB